MKLSEVLANVNEMKDKLVEAKTEIVDKIAALEAKIAELEASLIDVEVPAETTQALEDAKTLASELADVVKQD